VYVRIQNALQAAGWELASSEITNVVRTEPQTLSRWGIYKVTAYLEAVPVGEDHVRIYFHPYREYVTGGRSKIPFLTEGVQEELLLPLHRELEKQGLRPAL
jgi:hypothetical protein